MNGQKLLQIFNGKFLTDLKLTLVDEFNELKMDVHKIIFKLSIL